MNEVHIVTIIELGEESFEIRDETGAYINDFQSFEEVLASAKEYAKTHEVDSIQVRVEPEYH